MKDVINFYSDHDSAMEAYETACAVCGELVSTIKKSKYYKKVTRKLTRAKVKKIRECLMPMSQDVISKLLGLVDLLFFVSFVYQVMDKLLLTYKRCKDMVDTWSVSHCDIIPHEYYIMILFNMISDVKRECVQPEDSFARFIEIYSSIMPDCAKYFTDPSQTLPEDEDDDIVSLLRDGINYFMQHDITKIMIESIGTST